MHQTERKALADRLLGTAEKPGPIDVGWVKARYGITGTTIQRWRESGISEKRADDLVEALSSALGMQKEAAAPDWARRLLERVDAIYERQGQLAGAASQAVIEVLASPEKLAQARAAIDELEERLRQRSEAPPERNDRGGRGAGSLPALEAE